MTVGISPDQTETVTAVRKGVTPLATASSSSRPTTGQLWPRGTKA